MAINHNVPYFSQEDNNIEPWRTCSPTSAAMCLKYFNVADLGSFPQYEDDVKARFDILGIDHGSPDGIRRLLEGLGLRDNLTMKGSLSDITLDLLILVKYLYCMAFGQMLVTFWLFVVITTRVTFL